LCTVHTVSLPASSSFCWWSSRYPLPYDQCKILAIWGKLLYNKYKATLYTCLKYTISMIPFYWVKGPPSKNGKNSPWKTLPTKHRKDLIQREKYSFRKGSFSPLKRFCHHTEEREEKLLCTKVNYIPYKGNGLHLQKRRIFHKVGKRHSNHILKAVPSRWILSHTEGRIV